AHGCAPVDEPPRAGRAARAAAYHDDVGLLHGESAYCMRVQGTYVLPRRVKTTWSSCIAPVSKATCDPARYRRQARTKEPSNMREPCSAVRSKRSRQCCKVIA